MVSYYIVISLLMVNMALAALPGPLVYVITPSPNSRRTTASPKTFYYNNWRRMDEQNTTVSTTTRRPAVKTPDLIFAEFEADDDSRINAMKKSLRQLLERERLKKSTTTTTPIPDVLLETDMKNENKLEVFTIDDAKKQKESNVMLTSHSSYTTHGPIYSPKHDDPYEIIYKRSQELPVETSTKKEDVNNPHEMYSNKNNVSDNNVPIKVEDIWHVIDNEKVNENTQPWQEVLHQKEIEKNEPQKNYEAPSDETDPVEIDQPGENFAYPGLQMPGSENESRAIRTQGNVRFPYVNLKTFQMKNGYKHSKPANKNKNIMMSLEDIEKEQYPLKGVANDQSYQHIKPPGIDRYNPAQPYLAPYGIDKVKQPSIAPTQSVSNLIPPPRPPPPVQSFATLPPPSNYESFPPFSNPTQELKPDYVPNNPPETIADDSDMPPYAPSEGYNYKPPMSSEVSDFSTPMKPQKPPMKPSSDSDGYQYKPPVYQLPAPKPQKEMTASGYNYNKPSVSFEPAPVEPSHEDHGHLEHPPVQHNYPEIIFDKHHQHEDSKNNPGMPDTMAPPPPPSDNHSGYPSAPYDVGTFPDVNSLKHSYGHHHDFEDYDHYHHHHETTTTSTTEMPRVNRYSYYYLGKKLYYLPLYFSVYFVIYVGSLIIKSALRHKITYPNSWRPAASRRTARSVEETWHMSSEDMHELTRKVTHGILQAAEEYKKTS